MNTLTIPNEIRQFLQEQNWIFAKTYAKTAPHWYIIKNEQNREMVEQVETIIREQGYIEKYYTEDVQYCNIDGYKYWACPSAYPEGTIIINRVPLESAKRL